MFKTLIRKLTRWAWQHEINVAEGIARLESLHMTPNAMELDIKINPAQREHIAQCFASLVASSENYTEIKYDMVAKNVSDGAKWITVTVLKGSGKTPHQLKALAEAKILALQAKLAELEKAIDATPKSA